MSNMRHCPHCHCSTNVVKNGVTSAKRRRYRCRKCRKTWTTKAHPQRLAKTIWHNYAIEDMHIKQLCKRYKVGNDKIREILHSYEVPLIMPTGQHDILAMDCTYFGKRNKNKWGMLIVKDALTGECLYCEETPGYETYAHYIQALNHLEVYNIRPKACIIDGITGLAGVLEARGILVQYCQFHQIKTIIGYLTRNPILDQNKELKHIALQLTHVPKKTFIALFNAWYHKNQTWLKEKSRNPETNRLEYTHQKTRSAVHSLQRNFKYLYTFEEHPELKIPNTNNCMEGTNSAIKSKLNHHRGTRKDLKIKLIRTILSDKTGV